MNDLDAQRNFPRNARLTHSADFAALRHESSRIGVAHFACQYRHNEVNGPRLGMAVSRRVSKLAVVRNRIRRQIRESFRLHRVQLPACDVLVIASASAAMQSNAVLRSALLELWTKLVAAAAKSQALDASARN